MTDSTDRITPIFLFSLPRSGSTLVQRVLAVHPAIETASEPWILLPYFFTLIPWGVYAAYGQRDARRGIADFCAGLPGGTAEYLSEIKALALRLYERRVKGNARYFLDKTPRYHVIAPQILKVFDEARFVFLWRNPLAIIASMIETWGRGRWNIYQFEVDLYDGLDHLIAARREAGDRACSFRFEDLVAGGNEEWQRMFASLNLEFDDKQLALFSDVKLTGRMGDPTGPSKYHKLSQEPIDKWKDTLASPLRKMWCRRYLRWIGEERLQVMGYDSEVLLRELDAAPIRFGTVATDVVRMLYGLGFRTLEPWILRDKVIRLRQFKRVYSHF